MQVRAAMAAPMIALPGLAKAQTLTPATIFGDAALPVQLAMIALMAAAAGGVAVTVRKLRSGPQVAGGSAYLSALRLGGPLVGLLSAAFTALMMFVGLSNLGPQPVNVLAPGLAEATFVLLLGLFTGLVAVVCHWVVEARIDRAVLQS